MEVMVFYIDSEGKRRGWAKGDEESLDDVRRTALERLEGWIAAQNAAIGEEEWTIDDFEEFVAEVRETS